MIAYANVAVYSVHDSAMPGPQLQTAQPEYPGHCTVGFGGGNHYCELERWQSI